MKEDCEDLLDEIELARLIKQYSEFISFPIKLWSKQRVPRQVEDEEATKKAQEFADKKATDEGKVCRRKSMLRHGKRLFGTNVAEHQRRHS